MNFVVSTVTPLTTNVPHHIDINLQCKPIDWFLYIWRTLVVNGLHRPNHCLKSVKVQSFSWSVFSHTPAECGNIRSKSLYSARIRENTDQKKLRIWALFAQWLKIEANKASEHFMHVKLSSWEIFECEYLNHLNIFCAEYFSLYMKSINFCKD